VKIFDVAIQQKQPLCTFKSSTFLAWVHSISVYAHLHGILVLSSLYIVAEVWFGYLKIIKWFSSTDFISVILVA